MTFYHLFYLYHVLSGESLEYRGMLVFWCTGYWKVCCVCMYVVFWQTTGYKVLSKWEQIYTYVFLKYLEVLFGFFEFEVWAPFSPKKLVLRPKTVKIQDLFSVRFSSKHVYLAHIISIDMFTDTGVAPERKGFAQGVQKSIWCTSTLLMMIDIVCLYQFYYGFGCDVSGNFSTTSSKLFWKLFIQVIFQPLVLFWWN